MNVEWLASQEGRDAIASLRGVDPLQARSALPGVDADLVSQALTQAQHRPVDFPLALVTRDGIQQASPVAVARRRATRLAEAGVTDVIDAGCGIGLDSWAFAEAGLNVVAVEVDPTTAAVARANLAGFGVEVRTGDATSMALPPGVLFVDPARRREHADADG
ncbi:MAG: class I SAM-dependent methyltransferase, partial [Candidatus Nanopelagicales bacterium]|nr:class I SAM-dependent methyltransferase [Candidatus Nanopelagicales bacterium]